MFLVHRLCGSLLFSWCVVSAAIPAMAQAEIDAHALQNLRDGIARHPDLRDSYQFNDGPGVVRAAHDGDVRHLESIAENEKKFFGPLALIFLARAKGDMDQADRQTEEMRAMLAGVQDPGLLLTAIKFIGAGNDFLAGRYGRWARDTVEMKRSYYPLIRAGLGMPDFTFTDLEEDTITVDPDSIHDEVVQPSSASAMPGGEWFPYAGWRRHFPTSDLAPMVTVTLNGHPVEALVNTTSESDVVPRSDAARIGVRVIGRAGMQKDSNERVIHSDLAVVATASVGGVRLQDHLVEVTDSRFFMLGMNTLRRLGRVRLTRDGMHFGAGVSGRCTEPLVLRDTIAGHGMAPIVRSARNGREQAAILNTGDTFDIPVHVFRQHFNEMEQTLARKTTANAIFGSRQTDSYEDRQAVSIQDVDLGRPRVIVERNGLEGVQRDFVTAYSLFYGDWLLDFTGGTSCFIAKAGHMPAP